MERDEDCEAEKRRNDNPVSPPHYIFLTDVCKLLVQVNRTVPLGHLA